MVKAEKMAKAKMFQIFLDCLGVIFVYFILIAGMASASQMLISAMEYKERVGFTCVWLILNLILYLFFWLAFHLLTETSRDILLAVTISFFVLSSLLLMMASIQLRDEIGYSFSTILLLSGILVPIAEVAATQDEFTLLPI